jgi:hypothetical protein
MCQTNPSIAHIGLATQVLVSCGANSEEKHESASDIDAVMVDSLKALDPERPIREVAFRKCGNCQLTEDADWSKFYSCCQQR